MRILVLTISDRASRGEYEDLSGPAVEEILLEGIEGGELDRAIVPDERDAILDAFETAANQPVDVILTTGGTGIGPRDITPDVTEEFCDRLIPGIAEHLRAESLKETKGAVLSRAVAGVKGPTIVVNMPGSVKGASFYARLLVDILPHAIRMVHGGGH